MAKVHDLRIESRYYPASVSGAKNFEVRKNDRNYQVGDILHLYEFTNSGKITGREHYAKIQYILSDCEYLKEGYVVLGLIPCVVESANEFNNYGGGTMIGHVGTINMG